MRILLLDKLSAASFLLLIIFKILGFKIFFISITKYFRNKKLLAYLEKLNIHWFNYQIYNLESVKVEQMIKVSSFSKKLSTEISNKFWNPFFQNIYENKNYLNSCLNRKIHDETLSSIEIMEVCKSFHKDENKVFLWIDNSLINKNLNSEFYNFKNLNFFPNIQFKLLLTFIRKVVLNVFRLLKSSNLNIKKNDNLKIDDYNKFKIACYPHKGIIYGKEKLFIKDYFYSYQDENDPFFYKNILHVEWAKDEVYKSSIDYYQKNNIKYIFLRNFISSLSAAKIFFKEWSKNLILLVKLVIYDYQIATFFIITSFNILKIENSLKKINNVKMLLSCSDILLPIELSIACKKKKIITVAVEDRPHISPYGYEFIYDYYFVSGEKSKNIIEKRMPKYLINHVKELYLVKTDKYERNNINQNDLNQKNLNCIVMNYHSSKDWYENGRSSITNWESGLRFLHIINQLSTRFKSINFLIKSKSYEWLNIPYYSELVKKFKEKENILILSDQEKWNNIETLKKGDFAISVTTSLADEMLSLGKPVIIYNSFGGFPERIFDYGKRILANNFEEIAQKIDSIISNYQEYNLSLEEDRKKLFYEADPGKLKVEINKIFNSF
tara:strand:- start:920 stop:2749 length:1830 start_codon:yes stop_codon:yes gene_type:complete